MRIALEPVAIKSQLSPQGKQIFWNITAGGYQLTGVGLASQAAMLFSGRYGLLSFKISGTILGDLKG